MDSGKYYYNTETLRYEKVVRKKRRTFRYTIVFMLAAALFGFLFVAIASQYVTSPKSRALQRELENLQLQFKVLNKKMDAAQAALDNVVDRDNRIYRVYFEADPIPDTQRKSGLGGVNRYHHLEGFNNSSLIVKTSERLDVLRKEIVVQSKSLDEIVTLAKEKEKLLAAIPAIQPISNKDLKRISSGFGIRTDPFTKQKKMHWGIDFAAPVGTPVYATGDGVVVRADNRATGFGNHIVINHGFGYVTTYAHLSRYHVKRNQHVKRGDLIGYTGNTGRSNGPHLHYQIAIGGKCCVNPINYFYGSLTAQEYNQVLQHASLENQSLD